MKTLLTFIFEHELLSAAIFVLLFLVICFCVALLMSRPKREKRKPRVSWDVVAFENYVYAEKSQENYDKAKAIQTEFEKTGPDNDEEMRRFTNALQIFERKYLII